ncbi:MAG: YdeI/OmpD-associated family protein [Chloroflexota bacterium]
MKLQRQEFEIVLVDFGDGGHGFAVPFDVRTVFGLRTQIKVRGTIDGVPYRGSIAPYGSKHYLSVNRTMRNAIHKGKGEMIQVVMELDTEPRMVELPEDLLWALDANDKAKAIFDKFGYSYRKEFVSWIESARKAETRARRIQEAIQQMVAEKQSVGA